MAFEDAFVLAKCVEANPSLTSALQRYEDLRKPRATKIQAKARANADLFHMNGLRAKASLHAASLLPARTALAPLDRIYGFDPTQQPTGAGWRSVT